MKIKIIIIFSIISANYFAQFKEDFIVKSNGDTVKMKIENIYPEYGEACARVNGKKECYRAKDINAVYGLNLLYESVSTKKNKWSFMIKELSGDITVYRRIRDNGDNGNSEKFYFRQKDEPKGQVRVLSEKNVIETSSLSCKPVMDSLFAKKDWTAVLTEILKKYNTRCEEIKASK